MPNAHRFTAVVPKGAPVVRGLGRRAASRAPEAQAFGQGLVMLGLVICQRFHQLCPVLVRVYCDIFLV